MITVGYGDIAPNNPIEYIFSVIIMFFTGIFYAYNLSCIGNIIANINDNIRYIFINQSHPSFSPNLTRIQKFLAKNT